MAFINPHAHTEFCPFHKANIKGGDFQYVECTCGQFPWDQPGIPACKTQEEWDERRKNGFKSNVE